MGGNIRMNGALGRGLASSGSGLYPVADIRLPSGSIRDGDLLQLVACLHLCGVEWGKR